MKYKIAVASTDGKVVNEHFGKAETFYIVEGDSDNKNQITLLDIRNVSSFCGGGEHNDRKLSQVIEELSDCRYVLVSRIGYRAAVEAEERGLQVFEIPGVVQESVTELLNYMEIQNMIAGYSS